MVFFVSCGMDKNEQTVLNDNQSPQKSNYSKEQIDKKLLGDWGIFAHIVDGVAIQCLGCPRIEFNDSGLAILTFSSSNKEKYKWRTFKDTLSIEFIGENKKDQYFPDSKYKMKFEKEEDSMVLVLSLPENQEYILRK